ncbi:hypothetical protein P353_10270 [Comamonas testosteroni]|uniref:Uncharacterized protein n=1 Tax=Comamonas testosteroni TaxID=285 RepID=A0A096HNS4_COMTE|nr:hypothetical protein P353_10270 [Comamonas testosteroni]
MSFALQTGSGMALQVYAARRGAPPRPFQTQELRR